MVHGADAGLLRGGRVGDGLVWQEEAFVISKDLAVPAIVQAMFDLLNPDQRNGDEAVFSSGYGSGGLVLDVGELAEAAWEAVKHLEVQFS